jgi:peptide chain release factor 1
VTGPDPLIRTLEASSGRHHELEQQLADPDLFKDPRRSKALLQEHASLQPLVTGTQKLQALDRQIAQAEELVAESSKDMATLAREELAELVPQRSELLEQLRILVIPKDPRDSKDIIMEIRAGTGGGEAALFASDLFRMYSKYADTHGWKVEVLSSSVTEIGGMKELVFSVAGADVFERLRYESGVHRVQRVPVTESSGRIHTSAVTVAVMPEAEETEVEIKAEEIRVDVFRSSGPGGQSVNTTDSAVRITHLPSGLVVSCQDEKSQHKNRAKAMRVLRARLLEAEEEKRHEERAEFRRSQVGTGDRSERVRTYNFPQGRLTDHRVNLTLYKLEDVMLGHLEEVIEALQADARASYLQADAS